MAIFEYSALTSTQRLMRGTIEASSHEQAKEMLEEMQLTVNDITKAKEKKSRTAVGRSEFLLFNQQLASITKAGIPLEQGLRQIAGDIGSKPMRKLITSISDDLANGQPIEEAIEKRQKNFPPLYGRILKAGIETGRLSEMLTSLNRHLEVSGTTRRIIFEALCYPTIVLIIGAVIVTAVFMIVIPQFSEILFDISGGGVEGLPMITGLFITMADHVVEFWAIVLAVVLAMVFIWSLLSASPGGRKTKETMFIKTPIIGRIYRSCIMAKMSEAMAMLVNSGCTMASCFRLSAGASGSEKIKFESELIAKQIESGAPIMESAQLCKTIPKLFLYSIQLGTQRNELQTNLESLGQMYSEQTRCLQLKLQALMLPIMLVFVGALIALMVTAMFLPMIRIITVMM